MLFARLPNKYIKMKNVVLFAAILGIIFFNHASTLAGMLDSKDGIQFFDGSWDATLKKANQENKLIFLDIYATWCGPCKQLKKKTFPDKALGIYFNATFINLSIDGESADGLKLVEKYHVEGYPALLVLDSHGNVISESGGYMPPSDLLEFGHQAVNKRK